jgi:hypothetical protein
MKVLLLHILFLLLLSTSIFAQGEFDTEREPDKYNMHSYGIKINSNGAGLYYNYSTRINYRNRRFFEAEFNYVKSPKEVKFSNTTFGYSSRYVYGKTFSFSNLKFGYGINRMIFEKRDKKSISVHLLLSGGGVIGISKPIYYEVIDSIVPIDSIYATIHTSYKIFNSALQSSPLDIAGRAPFILGLSEINFNPGIYVKFGIQCDFSRDVMKSQVLETGVIFDTYLFPVEIMSNQNNSHFLYLYLSYHFGQKYDARLNREYRKDFMKEERKNN